MKFKTRKQAKCSVSPCRNKVNRKSYTLFCAYLGTNPITRKMVRLFSSSRDRLEDKIDEYYDAYERTGGISVSLTPVQIVDMQTALRILADAGVTATMADCASAYVSSVRADECRKVSIGTAYREYLAQKRDGADKMKTVSTTGKFVEKFGADRPIADIGLRDVSSYVKVNFGNLSPKTYNSHLSYIKTFLNWCAAPEQKYLGENPAASLKKVSEEWKEPEYMKVEDVKRLFDILWEERESRPELLAYGITSFFCGVRAEEIKRMAEDPDAAKITLEDRTIRIAKGKGYTKGRAPRAFNIMDNALAWMQSFDYEGAIRGMSAQTPRRFWAFATARRLGIIHNAGRHTFITMHVAAYGDPAKTQAMVGTSAKMRADNYCGLASRREGLEYFSILPPPLRADAGTSPSA